MNFLLWNGRMTFRHHRDSIIFLKHIPHRCVGRNSALHVVNNEWALRGWNYNIKDKEINKLYEISVMQRTSNTGW